MVYRSPLPDVDIPDVSLPAFVMEHFDEYGERPALIDGPSGRTLTYSQLAGAIRKAAGGLSARGLEKGDVFAIYSPNLPEYAVAFFGVLLAGGTVTTINPLYTADELAHQLGDADAKFLLTVPNFLDNAVEAAERVGIEEIFIFGADDRATSFEALLRHNEVTPTIRFDPENDMAALPYSSGTTGLPKGVMLTHRNIVANVAQCIPVEKIQEGEVNVGILPFYHIYGMTILLSMCLREGATIVTMPRFDMEEFCQLVEKHKIESCFLVPPIILGLAKQPIVDEYDLSSIKYITSGAAPLPESVAKDCAERLGCMVKQGYGMTEASPVTHFTARDAEENIITSIGPAVPNTEYRVVDIDTDEDVERGKRGELWVRGPQVMKGYLNNPEASSATVDEDGWLHTGDVAIVDEDGHTYVVDRVKELIKYKGFQVAPAELEGVIQEHPDVADAAVIPSPDEEAGEIPKAFVVRKPNAPVTEDELMEFVAERVAPYKKVRRVEFVSQIPKTASGKILRRDLVKQERQQSSSA